VNKLENFYKEVYTLLYAGFPQGFMRTVLRCKQASEQSTILFTQGMELETLEEQEIRWFLGDFHI
jgi:hypothetical protein